MVVLPVDRLMRDVLERVVHPAHVPLEAEPQAAHEGGLGDARPRGRLLRDHGDAGYALVDRRVQLLQEGDGIEVLAATELVGVPLAVLARVVQVEHRCDGIHTQAIDVELLEPEQCVGHEEVAHLGAAEVEDVGAPVGLLAASRVGMLVQRGPVEARERPLVLREVRGHPVDEYADAGLVQCVDQVAEIVWLAEARGRREVRRDLVAPRRAVRVLGHGQELDVGEAGVAHVVGELDGEVAVVEADAP